MDRTERKRIERRIAKCERRLARGIDGRQEQRGFVCETEIKTSLEQILKIIG
jgi:hypothetical protein